MTRIPFTLALLATLAACGDGQPLFDDGTDPNIDDGTTTPSDVGDDGDIVRQEAYNEAGGGVALAMTYNDDNDTFSVDNLAFDGLNTYQRFAGLPQIGDAAVYQADKVVDDFLTGEQVGQIVPYFALYDTSGVTMEDGTHRTAYAIVRTGGYRQNGFGGYSYERSGDFVQPTSGQATFSGTYAGLRVFDTLAGIELSSADVTIDIDFDDFNASPGIKGRLTNRVYYDSNGAEIETFTDALRTTQSDSAIQAPDLNFVVVEGGTSISGDGEISGAVLNSIIDPSSGEIIPYESGSYAGILAGDLTDPTDGGEIVGVLVFEAQDSRWENVISQETGGFIATR